MTRQSGLMATTRLITSLDTRVRVVGTVPVLSSTAVIPRILDSLLLLWASILLSIVIVVYMSASVVFRAMMNSFSG